MHKHHKTQCTVLSVCIAWFVMFQAMPVSAASWTPLDTAQARDQARTATRENYPDADVVVVDQQTWTRYAADGTYVEWFEQYAKVLTEKGRQGYRTITSSFTIPYNTTEFMLVEVISIDGTSRRVDVASSSREMVSPSQMASNIYNPNDRILQVTIPDLALGDVVHFITYDEFTKPRMAGEFSDFITLEGTDPVIRSVNTVVGPRDKPLKSIALKNELPGRVTSTTVEYGDEVVYQWVARDIPRAFAEPAMPPLYTQAQRLLVSTVPDWQTVSRWYWRLSEPHLADTTPAIRARAQALVKGKSSHRERIEAVFYWVSREIRYLGITAETEAPGYEPHPVSMTFERRAGVCRDKAALLVAMLRTVGIDAYPVLIMNGPRKDPEVPQPFFNHAVVGVRNKDGTFMLMDPTDENTRELFPSYLNNQSFLVATPRGETLMTSPVDPAELNMMKIVTTCTLDVRGTLTGTSTMSFDGINDNAYRGHLSMLPADERKKFFEKILRRVLPAASIRDVSIEPENLLDTGGHLRVVMGFSVERFPVQGRGVTLLPVFRFGDSVGVTNFLIRKMGLRERKYTYMTETTCGVEETLVITLDPSLGIPLDGPVREASTDGGSAWIRSMEVDAGVLRARNMFQLKLTEYGPDDYVRLQETLGKVEKANRLMPAFSRSPAAAGGPAWYEGFRPDVVVLDESTEVEITDSSTRTDTVTRRMKVLTYAGRKKSGEIQIPFNPVWEEISLERARVTSPRGVSMEIDPREINIMDQEWSGRAPRYPGGKILVASLPGVEEGCIIEYRVVVKRKNSHSFLITGSFQGEYPIEAMRLRIVVPRGMELHTLKADGGFHENPTWSPFPEGFISETRARDGEREVYEYSAGFIPPARTEEYLPPGYSFRPAVIASTGRSTSFPEVAVVLDSAASDGRAAAARSREITRDTTGVEQKIVAVRDFVARNIRAVPVSIARLPLDRITTADETLAAGYGHSADIAVLLHAMLDAIGLEPGFVLVSSAPAVTSLRRPFMEAPALDWYGQVLVRVGTPSGDVMLGDTDQYAALGTVGNSGRLGLDLKTGRIDVIRPMDHDHRDMTTHHVVLDVNEGGDALITRRTAYYGMDHARFTKEYAEKTPEELRRSYEEIVSAVSRTAVAVTPRTVFAETYPACEEYTVRVPSYAVRQGDLLSMELPTVIQGLGFVSSDERVNPLYRDTERTMRGTLEVVLPAGAWEIVQMPAGNRSFDLSGLGTIEMSASLEQTSPERAGTGSRMRFRHEQRIENRAGFLAPEGFPDLLAIHRVLSHPGFRTLVVRMR